MKAEFIKHKDEHRIKVVFSYNSADINKLKTIPGTLWSQTMKSWHIPDNNESIEKLQKLFPDIVLVERNTLSIVLDKMPEDNKPVVKSQNDNEQKLVSQHLESEKSPSLEKPSLNEVRICCSHDFIYLKLAKDSTDIAFLRSLRYYKWDNSNFQWIITNKKQNLDLIEKYFAGRLKLMPMPPLIACNQVEKTIEKKQNTLYIIEYVQGRVRLVFDYNEIFVELIKKIAYSKWDAINKWWSIPYTPVIHKNIEAKCLELGWKIEIISQKDAVLKRKTSKKVGTGALQNLSAGNDR